MKKSDIENRTREILVPILDEFKFELWDVEYVKESGAYFLRAYIDKEGGITIDDCVDVSRKLSDRLDEEDYIDDEYTLEVSSPGVERPLKRDVDFEKSIGREVYIKLYNPVDISAQESAGKTASQESTGKTASQDSAGKTASQDSTGEAGNSNNKKGKKNKPDKQKEFTGTLKSYDKETVIISLHNAVDKENPAPGKKNTTSDKNSTPPGTDISFMRKDIALIRLYVEF